MVILMYIIKRIYNILLETKMMTLAGSFAFFLLLNGGSFLFLFIVLSNYLPYDFRSLIILNLEEGALKEVLLYFIKHNSSLSYSIFLVITSTYSASSFYYHFMHISENLVLKNKNDNKRIKAITFVIISLVSISLILSITTVFLSYNYHVYKTIITLSLIVIVLIFIYILNIMGLNTMKLKKIYKGIIFSYSYLLLVTILFLTYIKVFSNFKIIYGLFSFLVIFIFYIYLISIGLLIGILINGKNIDVYKIFKK